MNQAEKLKKIKESAILLRIQAQRATNPLIDLQEVFRTELLTVAKGFTACVTIADFGSEEDDDSIKSHVCIKYLCGDWHILFRKTGVYWKKLDELSPDHLYEATQIMGDAFIDEVLKQLEKYNKLLA